MDIFPSNSPSKSLICVNFRENLNAMKEILLVLLILFLYSSCSQKKEETTINLADITKHSSRYKEGKIQKNKPDTITLFSTTLTENYCGILDSFLIKKESIQKVDTLFLPDRFNAKKTVKFYWKENADSTNFMDWEFKDSIQTENAFYNWMDCFGKKCKSLKIGEKSKIQKRSLLILVNHNHLLLIDSDKKIDYKKWISVLKHQLFGENWKFILVQPKNGKSTWMNYHNEIETLITI